MKVCILPGWGLGKGPLVPLATRLGADFLDLPGYGDMPFTSDWHGAIKLLAARLEPGSLLVGWSLGAMIALALAAHLPVRGVAAISASASFIARPDWPWGVAPEVLSAFRLRCLEDQDALLLRFVRYINQGEQDARMIARRLLKAVDPAPQQQVLLAGLDWLMDMDLRPLLVKLKVPVLFIAGERDPLIPSEGVRRSAALVALSDLVLIEQAAHAPFIRFEAELASALIKFCAALP